MKKSFFLKKFPEIPGNQENHILSPKHPSDTLGRKYVHLWKILLQNKVGAVFISKKSVKFLEIPGNWENQNSSITAPFLYLRRVIVCFKVPLLYLWGVNMYDYEWLCCKMREKSFFSEKVLKFLEIPGHHENQNSSITAQFLYLRRVIVCDYKRFCCKIR